MQHVLRCQERQSGSTECKKTPSPGPPWGAYSAPSDPLAGGQGGWLPLPNNPALGSSGLELWASPLLCAPLSAFALGAGWRRPSVCMYGMVY